MSDRRRHPVLLVAALALLAPSGCASMQQRVTESENRSTTLEAQVADLQATQQEIITRLVQLREDLERQTGAGGTPPEGADLTALQADIANLQEQVRILTDQLAALQAAGAAPDRVDPQTTVMPPAAGRAPGDEAEPTAESQQASLFDSAYADYAAADYVVAVSAFEEFVARYPDAVRAPDALYWMGESLAAQELHREARERFLLVIERYPEAPKVRDALLRAALEAVELGMLETAVGELRELIGAHPMSDAALVGCMQLDRMGEELPPGCRAL